jgi:2-polyprenyl-6-methoxyphenol hydroxylase-like FAD-dependent oxidoreductase
MSLRVAVVGGGPGGLFFASQLKKLDPAAEVAVFERNQASDVFGFGVVFSDATLNQIHEADPVLREALREDGTHWERIEVWLKGEKRSFGGNGMAAIHRRVLLPILQQRAREQGVIMRFGESVDTNTIDELRVEYDVVVGADGANSVVRQSVESDLDHTVDTASAKFIWFGTRYMFDGLTFVHRQSPFGVFAAHAYPISADLSTFIVETDEQTWRAAGLDQFDVTQPPGPSDEVTREFLADLFADDINHEEVVANNSRWASFRTRRTRQWHSGNVVLLGDAVHTAHFSVGSGTKMAMEDGIALARELAAEHASLEDAFIAYAGDRQPSVTRIQDSARGGLSWWERFGRYHEVFEPTQFAFHFFSRSIEIDRIEPRDPELVAAVRADWLTKHGAPAVDTPLRAGEVELPGRLLTWDGQTLALPDGRPVVGDEPAVLDATSVDLDLTDHLRGRSLVVIDGGTPLDRLLLSEEVRLNHAVPTIVVGRPGERLDPETAILSGRADAVAHRG